MGVIYKIENLLNSKLYIGQTKYNLEFRWEEHKKNFKKLQDNMAIHKAMLKYGEEFFKIEIIEECDNSLLNEKEVYWIKHYNTYGKKGYNCTHGGEGGNTSDYDLIFDSWKKGYSVSEICSIANAERHTVAKVLKNNNISYIEMQTRSSGKPVLQYTLEGKFIKRFESISEASHFLGINNISNIKNCCNKIMINAYNYLWKYENDNTPIEDFVKLYKEKGKHCIKRVLQFDLEGNYLNSFRSCRSAAKAINAPYHVAINQCCLGNQKTAYGYIWKYE